MPDIKSYCRRFQPLEYNIKKFDDALKKSLRNVSLYDKDDWVRVYNSVVVEDRKALTAYYHKRLLNTASVLNINSVSELEPFVPAWLLFQPFTNEKLGLRLIQKSIDLLREDIASFVHVGDRIYLNIRGLDFTCSVAFAYASDLLNTLLDGAIKNNRTQRSSLDYETYTTYDTYIVKTLKSFTPVFEHLQAYMSPPQQDCVQLKILCLDKELHTLSKIDHLSKYTPVLSMVQDATMRQLYDIISHITCENCRTIPTTELNIEL